MDCALCRGRLRWVSKTHQWHELSMEGYVMGVPTKFDFYRPSAGERQRVILEAKEQVFTGTG